LENGDKHWRKRRQNRHLSQLFSWFHFLFSKISVMGVEISTPYRSSNVVVVKKKVYIDSSSSPEQTVTVSHDPNHDYSSDNLDSYFRKYRMNTAGYQALIETPFGKMACVYADWTASGRCYLPIEQKLSTTLATYVANTHTETSALGHLMTSAYKRARQIIKKHVNASDEDVLVSVGSGMTGAVNKFQSILGFKIPEQHKDLVEYGKDDPDRPLVLVSHYEHHSNQISWENTLAEVVIVPGNEKGLISPALFDKVVKKYAHRRMKIAAISACSNVTGVRSPFHEVAKVMHSNGGYCFVDFATSFGYVDVDMHPSDDPDKRLDAIYCSPHKLLGGPGSSGIVIFHRSLYRLKKPEFCGGGTVNWTNPWGEQGYVSNIEEREDAGTPAFLQTMKAALAIQLKEEMTTAKMLAREHYINSLVFNRLDKIKNLHILAPHIRTNRLSIFAIYIDDLHYNLLARLLNDRFGIQCRGGCNCAGSYAHFLFDIDAPGSKEITDLIDKGDFSSKPGWCRISFHPSMSNEEIHFTCNALIEIAKHHEQWVHAAYPGYVYDSSANQFNSPCKNDKRWINEIIDDIFTTTEPTAITTTKN
jgi:selenocysteine lyase/cysteine desulfurase